MALSEVHMVQMWDELTKQIADLCVLMRPHFPSDLILNGAEVTETSVLTLERHQDVEHLMTELRLISTQSHGLIVTRLSRRAHWTGSQWPQSLAAGGQLWGPQKPADGGGSEAGKRRHVENLNRGTMIFTGSWVNKPTSCWTLVLLHESPPAVPLPSL